MSAEQPSPLPDTVIAGIGREPEAFAVSTFFFHGTRANPAAEALIEPRGTSNLGSGRDARHVDFAATLVADGVEADD